MTGTEIQILRIVAWQNSISTTSVARSMGVSAEYITTIMRGLMEDGYLENTKECGYAVTHKATKAFRPTPVGMVVADGCQQFLLP